MKNDKRWLYPTSRLLVITFLAAALLVTAALLRKQETVHWNISYYVHEEAVREKGRAKPTSSEVPGRPGPSGDSTGAGECPRWFQFIREDMAVWRENGGVTAEVLKAGLEKASLHVQVIGGQVYSRRVGRRCFGTREQFTLWGILMLLRRFPGQVPDVDLAFNCRDRPQIDKEVPGAVPGALFQYCKSNEHTAILWPDFSFWGYPEMKIPSWEEVRKRVSSSNSSPTWHSRADLAFWRGNSKVTSAPPNKGLRQALVRCWQGGGGRESGLHLEDPQWNATKGKPHKIVPAEKQCNYRYRLYIEGASWSVSLKYSLACGSTLLLIDPIFHDFFSRALQNGTHFFKVDKSGQAYAAMCPSLKSTLAWVREREELAAEVAGNGLRFCEQDLHMDAVYAYMLHVLKEYAALQRFTPVLSPDNKLVTTEDLQAWATTRDWPYSYMTVMEERGANVLCSTDP